MKKYWKIVFVLVMCIILVGCGSDEGKNDNNSSNNNNQNQTNETNNQEKGNENHYTNPETGEEIIQGDSWQDNELSKLIPKLDNVTYSNYSKEDGFSVTAALASSKCNEYVTSVEEKGFTTEKQRIELGNDGVYFKASSNGKTVEISCGDGIINLTLK